MVVMELLITLTKGQNSQKAMMGQVVKKRRRRRKRPVVVVVAVAKMALNLLQSRLIHLQFQYVSSFLMEIILQVKSKNILDLLPSVQLVKRNELSI